MWQIPWPVESGLNTLSLKSLFIQNTSALSIQFSKWVGRGQHWGQRYAQFLKLTPSLWLPKATKQHWVQSRQCPSRREGILSKASHLAPLNCRDGACVHLLVHIRNKFGHSSKELAKARCTKRHRYVFSRVFVSLAKQGGVAKEICK